MKILLADKLSRTDALAAFGAVDNRPDLKGETLTAALAEVNPDVLVVRSTKVTAADLDAAPELSLIIRGGAGVNTIDVAGASERGIFVANCPGKNSIAVAELAFAHILASDRHVVDGAVDLRNGVWAKKRYSTGRGIYGQTLALLGLGMIGQEMITRARAFGMHVVAWSRSLTDERAAELGVRRAASPTEAVAGADVVSVHVALTDDTRHLVDAALLGRMKDGALLVNTSRGGVVDSAALAAAVRERGMRAALDVFEGEPSGGAGELDGPGLFALDGVHGSHHIGASTQQAQDAVADEVARIVAAYAEDGSVPNCVNLADQTPATHQLVVRHRDRVGVLAAVLDAIRQAEINVQEVENVIFAGGRAACARIALGSGPDQTTIDAIRAHDDVYSAVVNALA